MLAIRLKRVGRANLAQYRVIVQDSRRHPKRGAVVEYIGTYDPHAKTFEVDKDRVKHFLSNGAQPSAATARLLKADGVKLPKWVTIDKNPKRETKNPDKLRKNQPKEDKPSDKPADEPDKTEDASQDEPKAEEAAKETTEEPKAEAEAESKPEVQEEAKTEEASAEVSEKESKETKKVSKEEKPQESVVTEESKPKKADEDKK